MAQLALLDMNGTHYLGLREGEELALTDLNCIVIPHGFPVAQQPLQGVPLNVDQAMSFIRQNGSLLVTRGIAQADAIRISYVRLLAVRHGLASPAFEHGQNHCTYNGCIQMTQNETTNAENAHGYLTEANVNAALTNEVKLHLRQHFTDRVCIVAFVFRARGHHYLDAYEELYQRLVEKVGITQEELVITHQHFATLAIHAVYPIILDRFWQTACQNGHCNGAMSKRLDVASAGTAGPVILKQGLSDLLLVAPGLRGSLQQQIDALEAYTEQIRQNRWYGSVNARYYGVARVRFDDNSCASIAATILSILERIGSNSPIKESPALKRIAQNAPISGYAMGRLFMNSVDSVKIDLAIDPTRNQGQVQNRLPAPNIQ